jgi:signal peptidase I
VTAGEPPNPYAAPTTALAHGAPAGAAPQAGVRKTSRWVAVIVALLAYPLSGAGFYLLGLPRRSIGWMAAGIVGWLLLIGCVWGPLPKIVPIAVVAMIVVLIASVVATAIAKPSSTRVKRAVLSAVLLIIGARVGNAAVKAWIVEAFQIPSGAMMPTLLVGDHIFIKKRTADVARGDVIVFEFPMDRRTDYVKRVVAIGGDTIEVRDGVPSINGVALDHQPIAEPCVYDDSGPPEDRGARSCTLVRETNAGHAYTIMLIPDAPARDHPRTTIPPGQVFVMGNNRDNSYDSRVWGTVPVDHIKGVATVIWWSSAPKGAMRWSRVGHGVE